MKKKMIAGITVLVIGMVTLIAGVVVLVTKLNAGEEIQDGEYLVQAENWTLEGAEGVVWDFTEIGKGTLTTNGHVNDYTFAWALDDGVLTVQTDWLYELADEYKYELDKADGTLLLTKIDESNKSSDGGEKIRFKGNFAK